ncbi:luciferase-type oxidoreductase, BA3436 family [Poseidonocella pacifica]|uniref:Luciferase-type oxidoreductase, BA3436 family n=1 Tax=Poseidonocella pacifica TaxID=871651 RepID=A0A1I0YKR1_9RHOB|nr:LLM class oxidoreductase [Poseidonocella pacifica]SFB13497.1 luciferase-type oxidoreductase, BA3436 family [Poseidonocella pacifica]
MRDETNAGSFQALNQAFGRVFRPGQLSIGLVSPLEAHGHNPVPDMARHIERAQLADSLGFSALWLRDVPFNVPSFGDAGQVFDPFVYLGVLASVTRDIALGVASIVLPLRHPAHVAKAAASADMLSGGRLLLGVASGDRPDEYPALNMSFDDRGARFRDSVDYIRAMAETYPQHASAQGTLSGGIDMLPKPEGGQLPLLITGGSQQSPGWVARNGDGWMTYPRDAAAQERVVTAYRREIHEAGLPDKPVMQSLYIDLVDRADAPPRPIHLGFQSGTEYLRRYLSELRRLGINHVALNLRFNGAEVETTMQRLAAEILPEFTS